MDTLDIWIYFGYFFGIEQLVLKAIIGSFHSKHFFSFLGQLLQGN